MMMECLSEEEIQQIKELPGGNLYGSISDYINNTDFLSYIDYVDFIDTGAFQYKKRENIRQRKIPGYFFRSLFGHTFRIVKSVLLVLIPNLIIPKQFSNLTETFQSHNSIVNEETIQLRRYAYEEAEPEKPPGKMKKGIIHLIVYLSTAAVAALSVIQAGKQILPWIAGIAVYVLAAVLMIASCVFLYHDLRNSVINKIIVSIKKNPFGERFLDDHAFRTILTTLPAFLINVAYTVYNGVIGIMNQSAWFITMAVYYSLLGIMRYRAVSTGRKIARLEDKQLIRKKELSVIKMDGILLLVLNLALSGVVLLTIAQDTAKRYSEIMVISIAAYTFYKITMALINMIKVRKTQSPILITIRNIGVADALVSMLTLQATMLASFQDKSSLNSNQMNAITGLAVCILIAILGTSMIWYAYAKKNR